LRLFLDTVGLAEKVRLAQIDGEPKAGLVGIVGVVDVVTVIAIRLSPIRR
jgi:hypothetical protein